MTEHVRIAVEEGVLRITLARPDKKNALTQAMYTALGDAFAPAFGRGGGLHHELAAQVRQVGRAGGVVDQAAPLAQLVQQG